MDKSFVPVQEINNEQKQLAQSDILNWDPWSDHREEEKQSKPKYWYLWEDNNWFQAKYAH